MAIRTLLIAGVLCWLSAAAVAEVTVETVNYHDWPDAIRLSNGLVEAVIVPEIGRIMHFGLVDGRNVLWNDTRWNGAKPDGTWRNLGGDKLWPWPQDRWDWPPPAAFDGQALSARVDGQTVVLTSAADSVTGLRGVRRIWLSPDARTLRIYNVLEPAARENDAPATQPSQTWGAWSVTQISPPRVVEAVLDKPGYRSLKAQWPVPEGVVIATERALILEARPVQMKIAFDASSMRAVYDDLTLVQTVVRRGKGELEPMTAAQIYVSPLTKGAEPYVELEFVGPMNVSSSTLIEWTLRPAAR